TEKVVESDIFKIINNRRSIRKFIDKDIPDEVIRKVLEAGFRAPFASQVCSVVYTKDKEKMKQLKKMGVYPTTKLLIIFIYDFERANKIIEQRNYVYDFDDSYSFFMGVQDVALVSENVTLAMEAMGLGSVLLGATPLFVDQLAEMFTLPPKAFPIVGLCAGYPDPDHLMDIRPRFPFEYSAFEDEYRDLSEEEIQSCMKAMDDGYITQGYYIKQNAKVPLKSGKDEIGFDKYSWSEHICRKVTQGFWSIETLNEILRRKGFDV
ncbi:MAG: nitroreductase family protein, partial [Candidatus Heimdallarchaeota archaeon]